MCSFKGWELEAMAPDVRLDVRGVRWPLVWVTAQLALERMHPGQVVELRVADQTVLAELTDWVSERGCRLLKVEAPGGETGLRIWIEAGA